MTGKFFFDIMVVHIKFLTRVEGGDIILFDF
jgi:hypothetical protein